MKGALHSIHFVRTLFVGDFSLHFDFSALSFEFLFCATNSRLSGGGRAINRFSSRLPMLKAHAWLLLCRCNT
jgi:hypothetical protein